MTKIKKRNELSIFNDFRIKPPTTSINVEDYPKKEDLHSLKLLSKVDKNNNTTSWWKKNIDNEMQFYGDVYLDKKLRFDYEV